jgi:hypothetical protein
MMFPGMPYNLVVPDYLIEHGRLLPHVNLWCMTELRGMYVVHCVISSQDPEGMINPNQMEFEHEHERIHFKMMWIG